MLSDPCLNIAEFMVIGLQIRKLHRGLGRNPPAVLDSKKPCLFRVKVLSVDSDEHSSIADHLVNTGHNMKWYHFEIPAGGKTSKHCLIKREPTDR